MDGRKLLLLFPGEEGCNPLFHAGGGGLGEDVITLLQNDDVSRVARAAVGFHVELGAVGTEAIFSDFPHFALLLGEGIGGGGDLHFFLGRDVNELGAPADDGKLAVADVPGDDGPFQGHALVVVTVAVIDFDFQLALALAGVTLAL
ncbi:hypothetical protein CMK17_18465 [Candidatus Poribacteria bacterium]|nr:hypothetical protein [Candidatus Poribacteria bacterium]